MLIKLVQLANSAAVPIFTSGWRVTIYDNCVKIVKKKTIVIALKFYKRLIM